MNSGKRFPKSVYSKLKKLFVSFTILPWNCSWPESSQFHFSMLLLCDVRDMFLVNRRKFCFSCRCVHVVLKFWHHKNKRVQLLAQHHLLPLHHEVVCSHVGRHPGLLLLLRLSCSNLRRVHCCYGWVVYHYVWSIWVGSLLIYPVLLTPSAQCPSLFEHIQQQGGIVLPLYI